MPNAYLWWGGCAVLLALAFGLAVWSYSVSERDVED